MPTPGDNIQAETATQPMAAAASGSRPPAQISQWRQHIHAIRTYRFDSPVIGPPPGLEEPVKHRLRTETSYHGPESVLKRSKVESQDVKRNSDVAPEDLQIDSGAATQERFEAMEAIPEDLSHDEMVSAVMSDLIEHKLLSINGLVVNEDSKEKEMQKVTSDIILQDFYVDADGVDSKKLKKAMDILGELNVFTDVDIKSMKAEEVGFILGRVTGSEEHFGSRDSQIWISQCSPLESESSRRSMDQSVQSSL
eukprot:5377630-Amphidinium_carterae.2